MQVVEVGVRNEHQIHGRKIANSNPGLPEALEHKQPAGEIGIDDNILSPYLQEEAGVTDKGDAHLPTRNQNRFMRLPSAGSNRRMANQSSKLPGTPAQGGISQSLFQHRGAKRAALGVQPKPSNPGWLAAGGKN